jgi:uncharacterized membrane protein YeaQ/YmgE (transglycosylase-associated protein family)
MRLTVAKPRRARRDSHAFPAVPADEPARAPLARELHRGPSGTATKEIAMSIVAWIVFGLIAGFIASKIVNRSGEGAFLDIVLGVVGAVVGGFLFNTLGAAGVTGFNLWSMFVAVLGSIVVLGLYHMIAGRRLA